MVTEIVILFLVQCLSQVDPPTPRFELRIREPKKVYTDADEIWVEIDLVAEAKAAGVVGFCLGAEVSTGGVGSFVLNEETGLSPVGCLFQMYKERTLEWAVTISANGLLCEQKLYFLEGRVHMGSARLYLYPPTGPGECRVACGGCQFYHSTTGVVSLFPDTSTDIRVPTAELVLPVFGHPFIRGDANEDNLVDLSDPIRILDVLFRTDGGLSCPNAADANDDNRIDLSDAVYIVSYLYLGTAPMPAPFPEPGYQYTTTNETHTGCAGL